MRVDGAGPGSSNVADAGQAELLATKLHLPQLPPGFAPRPQLLDLLDEGLTRSLTLVCAPAGFGKSALLADWIQRREPMVAWLSLDAGDNDPVRFWRYAVAALDRVRPGLADRTAPLLAGSEPESFDATPTAVVNELAAQPGEVLLVLDDYHLVDAEPVHASLSFLLERAPRGLHVVLATRADPPLPLARLRARGGLVEVRAAQLRFTTEEAAGLLRQAVGPDLGQDVVATLTTRTEGWAAGLQLAGLSLRGRSDVAELVDAFSGSHRYILDYLTEEVLERQPEPLREFLLETSVLERLSGPLCDAATGRTDSQRMLEAIERANLFLVPLDEARGWWRYHHLFASLLRVRLAQHRPERVPELHHNAAAWHERHGQVADAVHHARAAGEDEWAARLIERHFDALYLGHQGVTVRRWLAELPSAVAESRARLLLAQAWLALFGGRVEEVPDRLDAAERAFAHDQPAEPFQPSVGAAASWLANVPAAIALARADIAHWRGDGARTIAFSQQALAELGEDEWLLHADADAHLAAGHWLCGRPAEAERSGASALAQFRAGGADEMAAVWAGYYLGAFQRAQGHLTAATRTYQQVVEIATTPDGRPLPAAGVGYVGLAEIAYQRGELDTARRHLTDGLPLCRQFVSTQALATGLATLAWIRHAEADHDDARAAMEQAYKSTGTAVADVINPVPASRSRLLLAQGNLAAAEQWTAERGLTPDDQPAYPREPAQLVLARVMLARGRPDRARALLDRLRAATRDRVGSLIEIQTLRALAIAADGDAPTAIATLTDALSLAEPEGYVRVFADEGQPMWTLLGQVIAAQRAEQATIGLAYLGRLARACEPGATDAEPGPPAIAGLVTQLSVREREVLRLMAAGKQNQQIAADLFVALSTVKKHVTHILDKLGAANRTEATARARELGLL